MLMPIVSQIVFIILFIAALTFFIKKIKEIRHTVLLGKPEVITTSFTQRWKNVLLLALGQKKMFRKPFVALMHFIIYAGFIIINIEILEIILDGITGHHRLFAASLGSVYSWLINAFEYLAAGVMLACFIFLMRRNVVKVSRLWSKDLKGWPRADANYILIMELILMTLFLTMNAADTLLQQRNVAEYSHVRTGNFALSSLLHPLFYNASNHSLIVIERSAWWLHITGILFFMNYLPYSKHFHIILAFPNTYYTRPQPMGVMLNMPAVQREVLLAMQPEAASQMPETETTKFGAKDIFDLSWKNLLDAYSCTECGRCTAACPANITGKLLSPRTIMMKTRDRMEEVAKNIRTHKQFVDDGKSLLRDYISEEELRACTTCQACVQECPVSIHPLEIILQLRRYLIMEESKAPAEWNAMFSNIENNFAPWKFSPEERDKWKEA